MTVAVKQQEITNLGNVADAIAATLKNYGVRFAFGIPGNDVLELVRACEEQGIRYVLVKNEPSGAFMADVVYVLTGSPAVLMPAAGPGFANAISGIAGALLERVGMLVLSGDMSTANAGIYNHQVLNHLGVGEPISKLAFNLNPSRAAQQVARALDVALAYPPGPVIVNSPADLSRVSANSTREFWPRRVLPTTLEASALRDATAMLAKASRPVALLGLGGLLPDVPSAVARFIDRWQIPFFAAYRAKGVVDEHHKLCMGAVGLNPRTDAEALKFVNEADLIVAIGFDPVELRDAWLDAWPEDTACLSIDWGPQTHRIFPVGHEAIGHLPAILEQLTASQMERLGLLARGPVESPQGGSVAHCCATQAGTRNEPGRLVPGRQRIGHTRLDHDGRCRVAPDT